MHYLRDHNVPSLSESLILLFRYPRHSGSMAHLLSEGAFLVSLNLTIHLSHLRQSNMMRSITSCSVNILYDEIFCLRCFILHVWCRSQWLHWRLASYHKPLLSILFYMHQKSFWALILKRFSILFLPIFTLVTELSLVA